MTTASTPVPSQSEDMDATTVRKRVASIAAQQIIALQKGYLRDEPRDVAALARLRRGAGRDAADVPDLWTLVDTGSLHPGPPTQSPRFRPLSEQELTRAENAAYAALTLWAVHQQSRRTGMHRESTSEQPTGLGAAVRGLMPPDGIDEPVRKRLVRVGTAPDLISVTQRLRDLVVLLRRADLPLDHGLLAGQLYTWQWPGGPSTVRREWGRSFQAWRPPRATGVDATSTADTSDGTDTAAGPA